MCLKAGAALPMSMTVSYKALACGKEWGMHAWMDGWVWGEGSGLISMGMLFDVVLSLGGSVRVDVPQGWSSFAYVYDGEPRAWRALPNPCCMQSSSAWHSEGCTFASAFASIHVRIRLSGVTG
jgi:hypothetical protein